MSKSKNYNRIVFLTTLSVYLGLVLVGGTAPVLAHSALTKHFDIKNEIEVRDDLDKKPDDNLFAQSIIEVISDLDRISKLKEFDWEAKSIITVEDLSFCKSDDSPSYSGTWSPNITEKVSRIIEKRYIQIGRNFNKLKSDSGLGDFYEGYPEGISFNLLTENKSLNLEIKTYIKNDEIARKFFDLINSSILQKKSSARNSKLNPIYENTKVSVQNNQVFIVTRLPRAAIDLLVK